MGGASLGEPPRPNGLGYTDGKVGLGQAFFRVGRPMTAGIATGLLAKGEVCNDSPRGAMSKVYVTKVDDTYRVRERASRSTRWFIFTASGFLPRAWWKANRRLRRSKCMAHSRIIWPIRKRLTNTWRKRTHSPRSNIKIHGETTQN